MSITGAADEDGGRPTKVGVAISDVVTGLFGAVSVLAGLVGADDAAPRRGQRIDVSLLESTLAVLVNQAQNAFVSGRGARAAWATPTPTSSRTRPSRRPTASSRSRSAASASGRACARRIGLPGLAADPRYATNGDRVEHRADLRPILAARFAERPDGRVARGARRRRDPVRPHQRRRRRVRRAPGAWPAG